MHTGILEDMMEVSAAINVRVLMVFLKEVKGKGLHTCYSAAYMTQLAALYIPGSGALCGHPLPVVANNWTCSIRHMLRKGSTESGLWAKSSP